MTKETNNRVVKRTQYLDQCFFAVRICHNDAMIFLCQVKHSVYGSCLQRDGCTSTKKSNQNSHRRARKARSNIWPIRTKKEQRSTQEWRKFLDNTKTCIWIEGANKWMSNVVDYFEKKYNIKVNTRTGVRKQKGAYAFESQS